jgi:calcium-binding protein CML
MVVATARSSSSSISISIGIGSELGSLFAAFDADSDGRISASELRECMRSTLGAEAAVSAEEAEALVADADADGDGLLDAAEFAGLVARLHADAGEEDRHRGLRQAFGMYCSETSENNEEEEEAGAGCITPASLRRMLAGLGEHQDVDECRAMICRFDLDGDGVLSFDEFKIMMNAA